VKQGTQKDQSIKAPGPQYSQKREENDPQKGNSTTENHPKRMTAPYFFFLFFHGAPHYSPLAMGFQASNILRAKGVPKMRE
jgi:hypothetical protein